MHWELIALSRPESTGIGCVIYVQEEVAGLEDDRALAGLLASVPHPASVRALLVRKFFGRRWEQEEQCDYWLGSDGKKVVCLKICGATAAQVAAIRFQFDERAAQDPKFSLSHKSLCDLVFSVTGECRCD